MSFNNTYCCSELITRKMKDSFKHLDEKIFSFLHNKNQVRTLFSVQEARNDILYLRALFVQHKTNFNKLLCLKIQNNAIISKYK